MHERNKMSRRIHCGSILLYPWYKLSGIFVCFIFRILSYYNHTPEQRKIPNCNKRKIKPQHIQHVIIYTKLCQIPNYVNNLDLRKFCSFKVDLNAQNVDLQFHHWTNKLRNDYIHSHIQHAEQIASPFELLHPLIYSC